MADLRKILSDLGAGEVRTYIQSGNAIFRGDLQTDQIANAIEDKFGFRPRCLTKSVEELTTCFHANPFSFDDPKEMHFFFCQSQPQIAAEELRAFANDVEEWSIGENVVYLKSPGGLSKSKLAQTLEKRLGVATTARNWNTVAKLLELAAVT